MVTETLAWCVAPLGSRKPILIETDDGKEFVSEIFTKYLNFNKNKKMRKKILKS